MERELLSEVSLTDSRGRLNRKAVGWARTPLVDTSGIGGSKGWGRNKRWEYWSVITPTHILAVVVSSLDYAGVNQVWVFDRATQQSWIKDVTAPLGRGVNLPKRLGAGPVEVHAKGLDIVISSEGSVTRIAASIEKASFDVEITRPEGHDCLAVVVPWSDRLFQYTVKDVALPAQGEVTIEGATYPVPPGESWAVFDHGRGRWPYDIRWNWGAGSGVSNGHTIGIQVGGKWADGTGSTENGVVVDGEMHKISEELIWEHDLPNWKTPWRVYGGGLDATLTPAYNKESRMNLGVLASQTDQCFGTWAGSFTDSAGNIFEFAGLEGFAEEVHNRW